MVDDDAPTAAERRLGRDAAAVGIRRHVCEGTMEVTRRLRRGEPRSSSSSPKMHERRFIASSRSTSRTAGPAFTRRSAARLREARFTGRCTTGRDGRRSICNEAARQWTDRDRTRGRYLAAARVPRHALVEERGTPYGSRSRRPRVAVTTAKTNLRAKARSSRRPLRRRPSCRGERAGEHSGLACLALDGGAAVALVVVRRLGTSSPTAGSR